MKKRGRILVLSHTSEAFGSTSSLLRYLKENSLPHDYILHPLAGTSIPSSGYWSVDEDGNEILKREKPHTATSVFHYLYHFWLTLYWIFGQRSKYDLVMGINNLNAFCGLIFRWTGKTKSAAFYTVDYSEKRFDNYFVNGAYRKLDIVCARNCDFILSVSPRIQAIRKRQRVPAQRNLLLPNGVYLNEATARPRNFTGKIKLLYAGHLTKSKGVHLIVEALAKHPDLEKFEMHIFGDGPYRKELLALIDYCHLQSTVFMKGSIGNLHLLHKLREYQVGIALYTSDDDFNYYCDPIKVKEYLAARHAILISDVPWIADYIEKNGFGIKINNDAKSIAKALTEITQADYLQRTFDAYDGKNLKLDWNDLYSELFNSIDVLSINQARDN